MGAVLKPNGRQHLAGARMAMRARHAAVAQGSSTFFNGRRARRRWKFWNTKPIFRLRTWASASDVNRETSRRRGCSAPTSASPGIPGGS